MKRLPYLSIIFAVAIFCVLAIIYFALIERPPSNGSITVTQKGERK